MAFRLPTFNLVVAVWRFASDPDTDPPDDYVDGNFAVGSRVYSGDSTNVPPAASKLPHLYLLFPKEQTLYGAVDNADEPDTLQIPDGTGKMWLVHFVHPVALGFDNEHQRAIVTPLPSPSPPPPGEGFITEEGDPLTTEGGDRLVPES